MTDQLIVEHLDGAIVRLRLNGPPLNAIDVGLATELRSAAESLSHDASVHAVVLAGSGRAFAAGADVTQLQEEGGPGRLGAAVRAATDAIAAIPRPVIAAVHGFALGAGLELALAADFRLLASGARLGQPEILLGVIPGAGGTQRLPRLIGVGQARDLIFTGRQVGAEEAHRIGLADRVVPDAELDSAALAWAGELGRGPVIAIGLAKRAMMRGMDGSLAAGLDLEAAAFVEAFATEDARTGLDSFTRFGPGKAEFRGR